MWTVCEFAIVEIITVFSQGITKSALEHNKMVYSQVLLDMNLMAFDGMFPFTF